MVATLDPSEDAGRLSSPQREPQRGAEAIANFYGRFSTDHGSGSVRHKHVEPSLSSYANSIRRSSSGTEFYSQAHIINGAEDALNAEASSPSKGPRVYTSFSAAAAAASRSSLNKRTSQNSIPSNTAASPSIRNSPSFPSPHVSSSAFGDLSTSSSGSAVSGLVSPSAAAKGASFDVNAANHYTPASLASTFPWLSTNPAAPSAQPNLQDHASPSAHGKTIALSTTDSPPVSQYSKGKGFGWNPHEDHKAPRSGSRIRPAPSTSKIDTRDTRDSLGRGLGFKSTSELDLPERMRSQRKGALAPPRLSQDPIAISIEEELRPRAGANRNDSAFARLGRAFRRKSKTGSDLKADVGVDARDKVPPLPKTPRRVPSQALSVKPSDPFAAKALKTSSRVIDVASLTRGSLDVKGKQRDQGDTNTDSQQRMMSPSAEVVAAPLDLPANQEAAAHSVLDGHLATESSEARAASIERGRDSEGVMRVPGLSAHQHTASNAVPTQRDATAKATERVAAPSTPAPIDENVMVVSKSRNIDPGAFDADDEEAQQVESETQVRSVDTDTIPLTIDFDYAGARSSAPAQSTNTVHDASKRPTSMESTTSSARRRSLAFLASAISMGSIAAEMEEEANHLTEKESKFDESNRHRTEAHDLKSVDDDAAPARPSLTSIPVTVSRTNSNSSVPRSVLTAEQTGSAFTAMSRTPSSDPKRLEPKSATRNDQVPSILSDFLNMGADQSDRDTRKAKTKPASQPRSAGQSIADVSRNSSSNTLERSITGTSEGRKSSYSSSPKAVRPTKGVYMSPPAGPSMGGYISPFYVAPLTSVDSGLATRPSRTSGRRASASSRSVNSDDSRSVHSGPRRGSASLAIPDRASREAQGAADAARVDETDVDQSRASAAPEKARKVKSSGNLRSSANDQSQEAEPPAIPSEGKATAPPSTSTNPKHSSASAPQAADAIVESNGVSNTSPNSGSARPQINGRHLLRRPTTSGAEAGFAAERSKSPSADIGNIASAPRGLRAARASLDDSGRSSKPYSTSPFRPDFEMLDSREHVMTLTKASEAGERPRNTLATESAGDAAPSSQAPISEQRDSSWLIRRPSEASSSAVTPSSSRIETQGGAAALFGSPTTRPRTSSLLPSFGFSRSRAGSSAGLDGSGKSPGSFGNASRAASGGAWREPGDPFTSATRNGGADGNDQQVDVSDANRSPRASSSSRPSFHRQLSSSTGLPDAEAKHLSVKPGKKFSLSAFLPYDDEDAAEYAERIATTAPKTQIAAILASSPDAFYVEALQHFMTRFWFNGLPLDIALRKLLMDLHLPKETQQIDRVMEAFAKRYNECNGGLFASDDQPYILSFSLMMLHTDAFNKNAKNKMTKMDYLRNTGSSGVPTEILEYLYDNLTFTQFIYIEDEEGGRRPSEASGMSVGGTGMSTSLAQGAAANNRTKIDPYYLITQGRLGELRPDLEHLIPEDTPFAYTGTLPAFDIDRLNSAFLHAPSIEIVTTKTPSEQSGSANPALPAGEEEVVSLKVTKVGVVNRKDDVSDGGKKSASRKWKTSGLLLTGSQLLLFKDIIWINALQSQIIDQVGHSLLCNGIRTDDPAPQEMVEGGVVISPRITYFRPDGVISLADAVAVKDHSYGKYDFVFRLLGAKGRQYLVQAQSENDMNDWIHKINFCASFRTSNIKIRGLDLTPRVGSGIAPQDLESPDQSDTLESSFGRPTLSRLSFSDSDRASKRLDLDDSGRSTPAPEDAGDFSRELGALKLGFDATSRNSESEGLPRPPSSAASFRLSPAMSALQKRAKARRELMLTKIAETEVQLERVASRLADEIRLARHFAILTPFLKSTRDRIEMSALPLASRIRALRLEVAKAEARCKILRLDLAAGERVARALLPHTYSSSTTRAANRVPSAQIGTPQLSELGSTPESQAQIEELFAPSGLNRNGSNLFNGPSTGSASSIMVNKPASHQRNQMNLNAVSEQPADESPVMPSRRQMQDIPADDREVEATTALATVEGLHRAVSQRASSPVPSVVSHSSGEIQRRNQLKIRGSTDDEVPEDWDLSQVARPGTNRISLVDLPSPDELQEATGGRFHFARQLAE